MSLKNLQKPHDRKLESFFWMIIALILLAALSSCSGSNMDTIENEQKFGYLMGAIYLTVIIGFTINFFLFGRKKGGDDVDR